MKMSEDAKEMRNKYYREYRLANAEKIREYNREWRKSHPDQIKENTARYWEKKAREAKDDET